MMRGFFREKKCRALVLAFVAIAQWTAAQDLPSGDSVSADGFSPARVGLQFSLASLLSIPPGVQVGAEVFLRPRWSLYTEAGYVFNHAFALNDPLLWDAGRLSGARVREEARWYFAQLPGLPEKGTREAFFAAAELFYKYTEKHRLEWVDAPGGTYQERIEVQRTQHVLGGHFKFGVQGFSPHGFTYEISGGLGMKFNYFRYDELPNGASYEPAFPEWISPVAFVPGRWNPAPSLYFGAKVGYCFARRPVNGGR
jgi:hypothetical protein